MTSKWVFKFVFHGLIFIFRVAFIFMKYIISGVLSFSDYRSDNSKNSLFHHPDFTKIFISAATFFTFYQDDDNDYY